MIAIETVDVRRRELLRGRSVRTSGYGLEGKVCSHRHSRKARRGSNIEKRGESRLFYPPGKCPFFWKEELLTNRRIINERRGSTSFFL